MATNYKELINFNINIFKISYFRRNNERKGGSTITKVQIQEMSLGDSNQS